MNNTQAPGGPVTIPREIRCQYVRSPYFRTARIAGVIGGITSNGLLMSVFSEYPTFPATDVLRLNPETGQVQSSPERGDGVPEITRELEICLSMDLATAAALHQWLEAHLAVVQQMHGETEGES